MAMQKYRNAKTAFSTQEGCTITITTATANRHTWPHRIARPDVHQAGLYR